MINTSKFTFQLNRTLYLYRHASASILRSRSYTLARNMRVAVREPQLFVKKAARLILKNPSKLAQIILGKRTIQNVSGDRAKLDCEYQIWIDAVETPAFGRLEQEQQAKKFDKKPLISLITPVFNPPIEAHVKLIESVLNQTYGNFELLLFNFGDKPEVEQLLDKWAAKDSRIVVKHGLPNRGIGANSNLSLEYAKGEFVGLLDHDDALMPNALYECVKAINAQEIDFVYTDKDKISEDDQRLEPFFKPDWSPEMALGGNYMTHFNLMRTALVKRLGGWDPATDGAQDWDLFLRIMDETDKVVHIPHILYHWRTVEGSTSNEIGVKPYALNAQVLAVNKHLQRHKLSAEAMHDATSQMYVRWKAQSVPRLYIIHMLYGDIGNSEALAAALISQSDFHADSRILLCVPENILNDKQKLQLHELNTSTNLLEYRSGELVVTLAQYIRKAGLSQAIYLTDSIKKINNLLENTAWSSQLSGWLAIPEVKIAGGAAYAENGQVVDIGSFFNPSKQAFEKYYFSTGFRSGYNGYIQWIRNLIQVSERVWAFDTKLLTAIDRKHLQGVRDDELACTLAFINFAGGGRAVYDPAISVIDNAPFYCSLPLSSTLNDYLISNCKPLLSGDPYYHPALGEKFIDPKPRMPEVDDNIHSAEWAVVRSIELPY